MTIDPEQPQTPAEPDLIPTAEPADAAEQQRDAWDDEDDDDVVPDAERSVPLDEDESTE
ncbi:hypothetical protein GL325_09810 [Aeromicrobium sp. 636]|uniref:Uncharacterized protein n=1 Tax=Aeromicrobium senzhongii TaxID=2663859 RepID=A0A8I0EUX6_9ACTN|nr:MULTISPECIES: hypothetical protein [Aeromicrobium]MBC9226619.1 hypothetical protein [Aeromicrobium senzhongii]MCQ3998720.1 hypothetical protein [Aeromicrobium sp. 636]MTB89147.1 hypothetical protein [Aeromicrobium senzhongii]QNL93585.1 hypothetical protein H9L21_10730 [Aeromicrobium senzhongii]